MLIPSLKYHILLLYNDTEYDFKVSFTKVLAFACALFHKEEGGIHMVISNFRKKKNFKRKFVYSLTLI